MTETEMREMCENCEDTNCQECFNNVGCRLIDSPMLIYFAKTDPSAKIPTKRDEDAGYDIYACFKQDEMIIPPHTTVMIPTGIASACNSNYCFILSPPSASRACLGAGCVTCVTCVPRRRVRPVRPVPASAPGVSRACLGAVYVTPRRSRRSWLRQARGSSRLWGGLLPGLIRPCGTVTSATSSCGGPLRSSRRTRSSGNICWGREMPFLSRRVHTTGFGASAWHRTIRRSAIRGNGEARTCSALC